MKTLTYTQKIDEDLAKLTQHSLKLEKDNMMLRKALRSMANGIALDESGETRLELHSEDVDYLKYVVDQCNVFGVAEVRHEA